MQSTFLCCITPIFVHSSLLRNCAGRFPSSFLPTMSIHGHSRALGSATRTRDLHSPQVSHTATTIPDQVNNDRPFEGVSFKPVYLGVHTYMQTCRHTYARHTHTYTHVYVHAYVDDTELLLFADQRRTYIHTSSSSCVRIISSLPNLGFTSLCLAASTSGSAVHVPLLHHPHFCTYIYSHQV